MSVRIKNYIIGQIELNEHLALMLFQ